MARGVFLHREDSRYDDVPTERYQFPRQYLSRASQFVGDWIIYYEPRRGPRAKGYFAIARVEKIVPDPTSADMFIALIEPGSFLRFERTVPFSGGMVWSSAACSTKRAGYQGARKQPFAPSRSRISTGSLISASPTRLRCCRGAMLHRTHRHSN